MLKNKFYLRISTTGMMEIKTFDPIKDDVNDVIQEELNGAFYEIVHPRTLSGKFLMMVDDCGALEHLPVNSIASEIYGTRVHGCSIFGTAVIMREDIVDGEPDIVGLTDPDCDELLDELKKIIVIRNVCTGEVI